MSTVSVLATSGAECNVVDESSAEDIPASASPGLGPAMSVRITSSRVGGSTSRSTLRSSRPPSAPSPETR